MPDRHASLHAVIGVRYSGDRTYYVKRSPEMQNFPNVWSLLSIQYDPEGLTDPEDTEKVQRLMERMSEERLGGVKLQVKKLLTSGNDPDSPVGRHVYLFLYEIELSEEPQLNRAYYADSAWMTPEGYEAASVGQQCGLCLRLWSDYAWMTGIADRPFVARKELDHA